MKKTIFFTLLSLVSTLFIASCDSGNTEAISSIPELGGGRVQGTYSGTFEFSNGARSGTVTADLQDSGDDVQGNILFSANSGCLCNGVLTGSQSGFNIRLNSGSCTIPFRPAFCDNPNEMTGLCPIEEAIGEATYILSGSDANLTGSFTVSGDVCQNGAGLTNSGTITLKRR